MEKILLNSKKSINSVNVENSVGISLEQKARLVPYTNVNAHLDKYELYNKERDESQKYRFIFTINPICSNILYNIKTEVVENEGGTDCRVIRDNDSIDPSSISNKIVSTQWINRYQTVRDTEYSHPDIGLSYHCGLDILNNHFLRSDDFIHVAKWSDSSPSSAKKVFNTIEDYQRDHNGNLIVDYNTETAANGVTAATYNPHIYRIDNCMDFDDACDANIKEEFGWWGVKNKTHINIPNGKDTGGTRLTFNKLMNNKGANEFVDFYPDRSLFSFIPKVNTKRGRRIEKNWKYCLTYPYESDTETLKTINSVSGTTFEGIAVIGIETGTTTGGNDVYIFTTRLNHNLSNNEYVRFYYKENGNTVDFRATVASIGDIEGKNTTHKFMVMKRNFRDLTEAIASGCWIRREVSGTPCQYYVRKFKKILVNNEEPSSSIQKLAYGENIYGDRIAQILYSDAVDLSGLKDNRGRALSSVFLTIEKNNKGYKEWNSGNTTNVDVEYSHCFGPITAGYDLGDIDSDYNVRQLHNIDSSQIDTGTTPSVSTHNYKESFEAIYGKMTPKTGITLSDESEEIFTGDIVEFNPVTYTETTIEDLYHRFNTLQREAVVSQTSGDTTYYEYKDVKWDLMEHDDFDTTIIDSSITSEPFKVITEQLGTFEGSASGDTYELPTTLQPEGYFYKAHHEIKLRDIDEQYNTSLAAVITTSSGITPTPVTSTTEYEFDITAQTDYDFVKGDVFSVYDTDKERTMWAVLNNITRGDSIVLTLGIKEEISPATTYVIAKTDGTVPSHAVYVPQNESYVWRNIILPSETPTSSDVYDMAYSNGAFYVERNIVFPVKRQDPFGTMGLSKGKGDLAELDPMQQYKSVGIELDTSAVEYVPSEINICI